MVSEKELVCSLKAAIISRDRNAITSAARAVLATGIDPETAITEEIRSDACGVNINDFVVEIQKLVDKDHKLEMVSK